MGGGGWRMNLEFCRYTFWNFVVTLEFNFVHIGQQRTLLYRQNTCDLPTEYGEELRVSYPKLRNFRLAWLKRILFFFFFFRVSGSSVSSLRNKSTNTRTYCTDKICYFTNKILLTDWEELYVSDARVPKISARSLRSLAILWVFSSFWFSGRNKSSWTRTYHECYEHKDIYQQNIKKNRMFQTQKYKIFFSLAIIIALSWVSVVIVPTKQWEESHVSYAKAQQFGSLAINYGFFSSFWGFFLGGEGRYN